MSTKLTDYLPLNGDLRSADAKMVSTAVLTTVGSFLALSAAWVVRDYNQWVAFGTGGTPPNPSGYWRMTKFRWRMFWSNDDLRDASPIGEDGPKYLKDLPQRQGERPRIMGRTMPQRQQPMPIDSTVRERIHGISKKYCDQHPDFLVHDLSKTEGRSTDAIYAKPDLPGRSPSAKDRILGDELAHVHPSDNSLHVWLSPIDAKQAVEKGWGERFPLSSLGMLHRSFLLIYAPRTMADIDVIEDIVKASIGYLTGERL